MTIKDKPAIDPKLVEEICNWILKIESMYSRRNCDSSTIIEQIIKYIELVVKTKHGISS